MSYTTNNAEMQELPRHLALAQIKRPGYGSDAAIWRYLAYDLEMLEDLLPVVADPSVPRSPFSQIPDVRKVPSRINRSGHATGISEWTRYKTTTVDIDAWSSDHRIGALLQTRRWVAIDIDVDDLAKAQACEAYFRAQLPNGADLAVRTRPNSGKRALLVKLDQAPRKKRIPVDGGIVEILGEGCQIALDTTHPTGVRYEWPMGFPNAG